ncbi:uncharacterized protein LOC125782386 [Astyanax mexicanus]|uniref:uncharacterized protein LOC125782386 n=1 Tax=Astyanax mexicanus TaxID=7994 RepID=UPI0020CAFB13|nr:uncharacterized protein LOC125782386 [Astyanax mexicanus]
MGMPQMLQKLTPKINKKNGFLIVILVGLVVAAEFVEKDFMCPCEEALRWVFFVFYLFIPAFITLTVTYCIMCELYKQDFANQKSDVENKDQKTPEERRRQKSSQIEETEDEGSTEVKESNKDKESNEDERRNEDEESDEAEVPWNWRFFLKCSIPTVVWIILFFSDGRFVACLCTELKEGYADSNPHPPWEWCHKQRNLTYAQQRAETSYKYSKVVGFGGLFLVSAVILIYKCLVTRKAYKQQTHKQTAEEYEHIPMQEFADSKKRTLQE